ncbi:hypothetical protein Lal_00016264 [Lupinus albus]|uniref:Uncharacterized protein n=1 Tax=Lupinus albus TaxID=3870 RepID=A0A6A4QID0_LUPAL|nr:hypothetical protein Lalb_Chr05g0220091 [Lupinus albus]KAF1873131.1 hypothetical protein Lal_00016264 [Lupinus albus]
MAEAPNKTSSDLLSSAKLAKEKVTDAAGNLVEGGKQNVHKAAEYVSGATAPPKEEGGLEKVTKLAGGIFKK